MKLQKSTYLFPWARIFKHRTYSKIYSGTIVTAMRKPHFFHGCDVRSEKLEALRSLTHQFVLHVRNTRRLSSELRPTRRSTGFLETGIGQRPLVCRRCWQGKVNNYFLISFLVQSALVDHFVAHKLRVSHYEVIRSHLQFSSVGVVSLRSSATHSCKSQAKRVQAEEASSKRTRWCFSRVLKMVC